MMARCSGAALGFLALLLLAVPAAAEPLPEPSQLAQSKEAAPSGAPGSVSSVLFRRLPEGFPVEVIAFDDAELDLEIRGLLEEELQKAGHVVAAGAPLELSFTSEVVQGSFERHQPSLGRIGASSEANSGNRGADTGVDVELNVWSSTKDSVLGGRQSAKGDGGQARYHIAAQLRDRGSGQVLWQGDALCEMLTNDRSRLARSMVGPLVAAYGRSVKDEPFEID